MARWDLQTIILTALVLAAGLAAWALFQSDQEPTDRAPTRADPDRPPAPAADDGARRQPGVSAAGTRPVSDAAPAGVPRLLPADAALEDLRDALAAAPAARADALRAAWQAAGRVVGRHPKVLGELQALIEVEEDARLRAVATSALGTNRSDSNLRWLRTQLASSAGIEQRVGALLALARPDEDAGRSRAGTVRTDAIGGLEFTYAALPDDESTRAALARFLAAVEGEQARAIVPVLAHSVETSGRIAALLVSEAGELRRFVATLPSADAHELRAAALTHADLPKSVRRVLEGSD